VVFVGENESGGKGQELRGSKAKGEGEIYSLRVRTVVIARRFSAEAIF
jgi:hypothetical protein